MGACWGFPGPITLTAVRRAGAVPSTCPLARPSGVLLSDVRAAGKRSMSPGDSMLWVAGKHHQGRGPAPAGGCGETGPPLWAL